MRPLTIILTFAISLIIVSSGKTQTLEKGPWWPHPIWGQGDQAGGSNWITPEKVLEAIKLVETGEIYELGQVYEQGMPMLGARVYSLRIPTTGGPYGTNNLLANEEFIASEIGQVGTQFDGPGHIGTRLEFEDGSIKDVYYNGFTGEDMYSASGMQKLGVEQVKPIITRGILIDIAGSKNMEVLPQKYEVSLEDVKSALIAQGMEEGDIRNGDAIFFRYGWSVHWTDPSTYGTNPPGIGVEVANWIVSKNASMVGSDQFALEVWGEGADPEVAAPVHQILINQHGIWNLENMKFEELSEKKIYEFMFVFTPVPFKGATGSPGRPIAIR